MSIRKLIAAAITAAVMAGGVVGIVEADRGALSKADGAITAVREGGADIGEAIHGLTQAELTPATVVRVVDGDTFQANIDGSECTVRLIGVDTPESVHPDQAKNTQEGAEASDHTKEILYEGRQVWLQKDVSETDKYDRLLRYVWLEKPTDTNSAEEAKAKMLNARLVADGWAEPLTIAPDTAWASLFESLR